MIDLFNEYEVEGLVARVQNVKFSTLPEWGTLFAAQMLAHCNATFSYAFELAYPEKLGVFRTFYYRTFLKEIILGDKPYPKNSKTLEPFEVVGFKEFDHEKLQLIENINKFKDLGPEFFEGKSNPLFGKLTAKEWSTLLYKHLDHHLQQFNV